MKQVGKSNIYVAVWREKGGWCAAIEVRGAKPTKWYASGFETRKAAEAILNEQLKATEGAR
jgi:hypothetical protein